MLYFKLKTYLEVSKDEGPLLVYTLSSILGLTLCLCENILVVRAQKLGSKNKVVPQKMDTLSNLLEFGTNFTSRNLESRNHQTKLQ